MNSSSFIDLVRSRFSLRTYSSRPVEREKIEACVEAARLSPSACNSQPWKFVVVDDPELVKTLAPLTRTKGIPINTFVDGAPVIVVVVSQRPRLVSMLGAAVKRTPFYLIDVGIAAEHFCLRATEQGLGTCMLGWFNKRSIKRFLSIPPWKKIPLLITLGYPVGEEKPKRVRKSLDEILEYR